MAQQEELRIVINADTVNAVNAIKKLKDEVQDFGKDEKFSINSLTDALNKLRGAAEASFDIDEIRRLGVEFREVQDGARRLLDVFLGFDVVDDSFNSINRQLDALRIKAAAALDPSEVSEYGKQIQVLEGRVQAFNNALNNVEPGSLAQLNQELVRLRTLASRTTDLNALKTLGQDIRETEARALRLNAALNGTDESVRRSRIAVFGLNQVVRDLPFGFIAISNNIPVLIDQLVELRQETGSTGRAFSSFVRGLFTIGGVSLLISAGISLITTAVQKYGSLSNAFKELTGSITNAERIQRDFNKAQAEGQKEVAIQLSNLDRLISLSNNATIGLENQRQASQILRQEIDKIVVSQANQKDSIEGVSGELIDYAKRVVIARVNLKAFETVIGDVGVELAKTAAEGVTFGDLFVGAIQKINLFTEALLRGDFQLAKNIAQLDFTSIATKNLEKRLKELEDRQKKATQAADRFAEAQIKSGIATADLYNQQLNDQKKLAEEQRAADQERQRLARLAAREQIKQNKELQKAATLQEKLRIEFALFRELLDKPIPIILPESNVNQIIEDIRKARKELQGFKEEARPGQQNVFDISVPQTEGVKASIESINRLLGVFKEQQGAAFADFQERAQIVANLFNATLGPAIDNVFSAIENGENVFQAIGESLKRLVIDLVKTIAKAAILAAILSALSGGGFSFATFGALFKEILKSGGAIGTSRGPLSDVLAGRGGVAAPNISGPGGFALAGQVVFVQRGTDLVGVLDRSNARIGRVG